MNKVNLQSAVDKLYVYEKIDALNGHMLSVVQVENRTLDFHVHENSDELFYVIEGGFQLETEDGLTQIDSGDLYQ